MNTKYVIGIGVIIVGVITFFIFKGDDDDVRMVPIEIIPTETQTWGLQVSKQLVIKEVQITSVTLEAPGYVVVQGISNGKLTQIAEVSPLLPVGTTRNLGISLLEIPPDNTELVAIVYEDDGDRGFNPTLDTRVSVNGNVLATNIETGTSVSPEVFTSTVPGGIQKEATVVITYTDSGYTPATATIEKGQTISFVNNSSVPMWAASNPHPSHTILPSFDQFAGSEPGSVYQYTFDEVGVWKYHDHINPASGGVITVTEPEVLDVSLPEVSALPQVDKNKAGYFEVTADDFAQLADNTDVTMVNVHTPFAGSIPGTELSIPYNETEKLLEALPKDKNAPIALYCRGGGMSSVASKDLVAAGYTNVYDLTGGMNAYERSGRTLIKN